MGFKGKATVLVLAIGGAVILMTPEGSDKINTCYVKAKELFAKLKERISKNPA